MNWNIFSLKYNEREQSAFENMSYLLFCAEFNNRIGLFRYKNQTGIETEPIEKDEKYYGFQAKYYTTSISDNKEDIIDSIKKAKSKNSTITDIYLYVNKELSESSKKSKKKPQYQLDIEKSAKSIGVTIDWRVPSHFEIQLTLPENKYIHNIFFSLDVSESELVDEVSKHNGNILNSIQTEIPFADKLIKINRESVLKKISSAISDKKNLIISGEGGCGKTAVFKDYYTSTNKIVPICVFKANELNVQHINDIFRFENNYSFAQFISAYSDESLKIFVIDSAEKLAELTNSDILSEIIEGLKQNGWSILFTTRYAYLNDLIFHIRENYQLEFEVEDIPLIGNKELKSLSLTFGFNLPENEKFSERLTNLFYLNEYIKQYSDIDRSGNFKSFIDLLWKKRIQNIQIQKDNLHIRRANCIVSIVKKRCDTGRFYINDSNLEQPVLFQLKQDDILGYDETHDGYFITHDIYEEWTLDKIVSRNFSNFTDPNQFFNDLGNSLPIRRAFRLWLSNMLAEKSSEVESFINEAFTSSEISKFWQDEIIISVLLSNYSQVFFGFYEKEIIADDFRLLKRILFLLRIACTDIFISQDTYTNQPKGSGWEEVIAFVYKHRSSFYEQNLRLILPILQDWSNFVSSGKTIRLCGLLALSLVQKTETDHSYYLHDKAEENIYKIVFRCAKEIQIELNAIFQKVLDNKWKEHGTPYEGLCSEILKKPYFAKEVITLLPLDIIKICDQYWQKSKKKGDHFGYERDTMESRYGIASEYKRDYSPASANQTPIKWLLFSPAFHPTIDFIIDFTNRAVENYSRSDYGKEDTITIVLDIKGEKISQYISFAIWEMYRGSGSPSVPSLLKSIHMALETVLLDFAESVEAELVQNVLYKILRKSKSASLTAVVCSVVTAYPNKFHEVALILFGTIELFNFDLSRYADEYHANALTGIGYGIDKVKDVLYTDERIASNKLEHRKAHLESICLHYQFFGISGFTEKQSSNFIEKIYEVLDVHKKNDKSKKRHELLLTRMDRRNLKPEFKEENDKTLITFTPKKISKKVQKERQEALTDFDETFKYSALKVWSDFLVGGKYGNKGQKDEEYNKNPLAALSETRKLVEDLNKGNAASLFNEGTAAFACSKLMIEYSQHLDDNDKSFCRSIIISKLSELYSDSYQYQISDGVEASFHAIPSLIKEYPDEAEDLASILTTSLLDQTSIGNYKRICDYPIESIKKQMLWEHNSEIAQSVLLGYILLSPTYKKIVSGIREEKGFYAQISKNQVLKKIDSILPNFDTNREAFDLDALNHLDIHDFEIIYKLIPCNTKNELHLKIYQQSIPKVAPLVMMDKRDYKEEFGNNGDLYSIRFSIFDSFSAFLLSRETDEIEKYLQPFLELIYPTEESANFIGELIMIQAQQPKNKQFWHIWELLYPTIKEVSLKISGYYKKELLINYLLAWKWWNEGIKEWHSLTKENLWLYSKASKDMGQIPVVLYSISRVLHTIGSNFAVEGLDWIFKIISVNKELKLGDFEKNTIHYLETYLRKLVHTSRQQIKKDIKIKNKVLPILDFLIERGSVHAYLLRENII